MTAAIALVTCAALPNLEEDDRPLVSALERLGARAVTTVWTDPTVRWEEFDAVVLRSPIDYVDRLEQFVRWAASIRHLHNSLQTLRWNTDKAYLRDLDAANLSVIPTQRLRQDEGADNLPDTSFVVKPSVGVGSIGVGRYGPEERSRGRAHVRRLHSGGQVALIQPYLASVEEEGEASLVYVDANYTHAVRRTGFVPSGDVTPVPYAPTTAQRQLADSVVAYVASRFGTPLYARIDLLHTESGPAVNEVEVTDPILHLRSSQESAHRFALAILQRLTG